jgi:thiol-disulfide isomerase/thioredoxin
MKSVTIPFGIALAVLLAGISGCEPKSVSKQIHLYGIIDKNIAEDELEIYYDNDISAIGNSKNILVRVEDDGRFDATFDIERPSYFFVGYSTLYLSPGDTLEAYLLPYSNRTEFKGTSAEINNYLRKAPLANAGSYLSMMRENVSDINSLDRLVDSLVSVRREELQTLKTATPEFRDLENARITADAVNTYLLFPLFSPETENSKEKQQAYFQSLKDKLSPLIKEVVQEKYLDLAVVRKVAFAVYENSVLKDSFVPTPRIKALYEASVLSNALDEDFSGQAIAGVDSFLKISAYQDIKDELQIKTRSAKRLLKGSPAIDMRLFSPQGDTVRLSAYRGKPLYVDFWATWCSPCRKETPYFHELAGKYRDKEIVFLSVSVDSDREEWLKYLKKKPAGIPEYNSTDKIAFKEWNLQAIPRFILIDRAFNIFNAAASLPSSKEKIEKEIEALLQQEMK